MKSGLTAVKGAEMGIEEEKVAYSLVSSGAI